MTNTDLKKMYARLNRDFFDGVLPANLPVKFTRTLPDFDGVSDIKIIDKREHLGHFAGIRIAKDFKGSFRVVETIMLHEMVHIKLGVKYVGGRIEGRHGMRFKAELMRLFNMGAYDDLL